MSSPTRNKEQSETASLASDILVDEMETSESHVYGCKFNWQTGTYTDEQRSLGGLLSTRTFRLLCMFVGSLCVGGAIVILYLKPGYDIFTTHFPTTLQWRRELTRWLLFLGILLASHGAIALIVRNFPVLLYLVTRKGRDVPEKVATWGSFYVNVEGTLAWALYLFVPYALSSKILPPPESASEDPTFGNMFAKLSSAQIHNIYATYPWQIFANQLLLALLIAAWLFVAQKSMITKIAMHFHHRALKSDIERNREALRVVKHLKQRLFPREHIRHEDVGERIFDRIVPSGKDSVVMSDLTPRFLNASEAKTFFDTVDLDNNGDLTRDEFKLSIQSLYEQRGCLLKSIFDENQIIRGLDSLLHRIFAIAAVVIGIIVIDPSMETRLTTVGTTVMAATVLFHETAAVAFGSIVFIVVTHPFDVGDAVVVGDDRYTVTECGLWMCTFKGTDGKTVYLTNHKLRGMYIANIKRSGIMDEDIELKLAGDTSDEQLNQLERALQAFVEDNKRDYDAVRIKNVKILDRDRIQIAIGLKHKSNFQNGVLKNRRSRDFAYHLRDVLAELNVKVAAPVR